MKRKVIDVFVIGESGVDYQPLIPSKLFPFVSTKHNRPDP
jgi:hypothetical protein